MQQSADDQVEAALAAERESLSPACRSDLERMAQLLAPGFHEFGASGAELDAAQALRGLAEDDRTERPPISFERMRGQLLADGLVMVKYVSDNAGRRSHRTSLWRRTEARTWQLFHHQGTTIT